MKNILNAINAIEESYNTIVNQNNYSHLSFEVESNLAVRIFENNVLAKYPITKINVTSVAHSLINAASLGLSLSPQLDHVMIVPEINSSGQVLCKLHVTYKGLLHLCNEAGAISHITTMVIHKADKVRLSNDITSKPQIIIDDLFGDRGPVVGALCTICTPKGDYLTTKMSAAELDQVASMSGNSAWFGVFSDEFWKKQVLKRALHTLVSSYHGRLQSAAKFLTDNDMDLYESTERKAIASQYKSVSSKTSNQGVTRAETIFKNRVKQTPPPAQEQQQLYVN